MGRGYDDPTAIGPAEQRVLAALERIARDRSGAVVTVCEEAIAEARKIDQERNRAAPVRALAGLPFTAKDVLASAGTRSTAGCRPLADHVPVSDAPA
jgi:amidase